MTEPTRRERGMKKMAEVYAWPEVPDIPGDFFGVTAEHLFGDIWTREGLSVRDRRLLLLGVITALGELSVLPIQLDAALSNEELSPAELREITVFLAHYVGWPRAAALNTVVEGRIAQHTGAGTTQRFPGPKK
jgi:4-carboxymuconolactone decarboxylase